jgi:methylated-DNA-[protein]-cysteine S-methyltransferase
LPKSFDERVWEKLRKIPRGKVTTYKQIAIALGSPNAARAVGNACNRNKDSPRTPCHRVVKSDGSIGGYAKGLKKKVALLRSEGVRIKNNKVLSFSKRLFEF